MNPALPQSAVDVIVVGGGGSGLAAGLRAAECGARVLVLEKQAQPGGTTGIAVGSFTGNRTALQRRAGIEDSPQAHAEDAGKFAPPEIEARNHEELRSFFLSQTAATYDWLRQWGLHFQGPNPEPPNRVPRMHNVVPGAKAYIAALQSGLIRLGGNLVCGAAVQELIVEHGRVAGVVAQVAGVTHRWVAHHGVILAAGDYANSPTIIAEHKGPTFAAIEGINPHATGDGHRLARNVGARMLNMDVTYGPELRFVAPPGRGFQQFLPASGPGARLLGHLMPWIPRMILEPFIKRLLVTWQHPENALFEDGAILVNARGERFCHENVWPDREIAVASQPGKIAFIVLDARLIQRYSAWPHFLSTAPRIAYAYVRDYLRLRPDVAIAGQNLAELAQRRGMDPDVLSAQISQWQKRSPETSNSGQTSRQGQSTQWALFGPVKAYFTTTEGGASVDESMRVLDELDQPIPGLYAAGQNGLGGQILWGHGLHIAWALTSGRLAGEQAARSARACRPTNARRHERVRSEGR